MYQNRLIFLCNSNANSILLKTRYYGFCCVFFVQFYFLCTQNKCHVIFTPVFAWRSVQFNIRHELNRKIYNLDYNKILCSLLLLHMQISHAVRQQCGSGSGPIQNHETTDISLFIYLSTVHVTVKNAARDNTKKKKENHQLVGCFLERFPCSSVCAFDLIIMSLIFMKKILLYTIAHWYKIHNYKEIIIKKGQWNRCCFFCS